MPIHVLITTAFNVKRVNYANVFQQTSLLKNRVTESVKAPQSCSDGDLGLFNGVSELEGTLHICMNSAWTKACNSLWNNENSNVACQQLGYNNFSKMVNSNKI